MFVFCGLTATGYQHPVLPHLHRYAGDPARAQRKVVEYAVQAGLALNCEITRYNRFDRKNYFYPDLPKAYQVSQLYLPICPERACGASPRRRGRRCIRIHELHMEEDAGKLVHDPWTGPDLGGLQPLRRAPHRDRHRARLPHRRGGHRLSGEAEVHPGVSGGLGLQDAGGLPALRREPVRPARGLPGAWAPAPR